MKMAVKIMLFPVALLIDLITWIFCGLLSCTAFVFTVVSALVSVLAVVVMLTCSLRNGLILLAMAFLVSPMGLPMIATWMMSGLQSLSATIKKTK